MYRLGRSSLPSEGIGQIINLWTREVNDIRRRPDRSDLDTTPQFTFWRWGWRGLRCWSPTPLLTVFLASLEGVCSVADRTDRRGATLGRRPRRHSAARWLNLACCMRISACCRSCGAMALEDARPPANCDEHLERYQKGRTHGGSSARAAPLTQSTGFLYGAGLAMGRWCWM